MKQADKKYIEKEVVEFFGTTIAEKETQHLYCGFDTMKCELLSPLGEESYRQWVNAAFFSTFATWDETGDKLLDDMPYEEREEWLMYMLKSRPISVARECIKFTFRLSGISRSVTHQLVRHRKMAFGQQSLRVSDPSRDAIRLPEYLLDDETQNFKLLVRCKEVLQETKKLYSELVENGVPREQARAVLPIGITTKINATMDLRAMIDYFRARISDIAMAEHTYMVALMAREIKEKQPKFYEHISSQVRGLDDCIDEYLCKHENKTYQAKEDDTNVPEDYFCDDCGKQFPIPEPDDEY